MRPITCGISPCAWSGAVRSDRIGAIAAMAITAVLAVTMPAARASAADGIACTVDAHGEAGPIFGTPDIPQPNIIYFSGSVACAQPVANITGQVDLLSPDGRVEVPGPAFGASGVKAVESDVGYYDVAVPGTVHVVRTTTKITAVKPGPEVTQPDACVALSDTTVKCVATYTFTVPEPSEGE